MGREWSGNGVGGFALRYGPFAAWCVAVLTGWFVLVQTQGLWGEVRAHWPIAAAMVAGSYVAGSTPMGGGTVGFPVLVLLFDQPASLGRSFSFCIQSVGMTSATIFILCRGRAVALRMLAWTMAGAAVSVPATLRWLVPVVDDGVVKLVFACVWGSFGVMTLVKIRELASRGVRVPRGDGVAAGLAVGAGVLGGVSAGLTGVGIDMVLYTLLVLAYRVDIRTAVATSVIAMAGASLYGAAWSSVLGGLDREVLLNWLAAAPVVLFGAPFGALVVSYIRPARTLVVVSVLCLLQLVWAVYKVGATLWVVAWVAVVMVGAQGVFHVLWVWGSRRGGADKAAG